MIINKKYNFVYLTTNLINGKQYVGDHSTNDLNDTYIGSGILIYKALKRYNIQNFNRVILEQFKTKEDAFNAQEKYIKTYNTLKPNGYNISPKGGQQVTGGCSNETKKKISENVKHTFYNNPEILEKIRKSSKGRKLTKETKQKLSNALKGRNTSPEHSKHLSEALKNRTFTVETKLKMSIVKKGKPSSFKNKKHSPESLKKISEDVKNREKIECEYCHKKISKTNYTRWHGKKCKNNI